MPTGRLGTAHRLLTEAVAALETDADPAADADDLLSVLTLREETTAVSTGPPSPPSRPWTGGAPSPSAATGPPSSHSPTR